MVEEKVWPHLNSIFDIAGSKETGLAQSFGVIIRKDKTLLNKLIELIISPKFLRLSNSNFRNTNFYFEKSSLEGRTDIEIVNEQIHIIIESKIGTSFVKFEQANKYCDRLNKSTSECKCFVILTEIGNIDVNDKLKKRHPNINFKILSWNNILELLQSRRNIKVDLSKEFEQYILETQKMKIFDIDVWAVVVRDKQLKNFDKNDFYINDKRHSPIFIGKREWDVNRKRVVINEIRPVVKIHDADSEKGRKNNGCYVYELGSPLKLKEPIMNKFSQAGAIALKLSELKI